MSCYSLTVKDHRFEMWFTSSSKGGGGFLMRCAIGTIFKHVAWRSKGKVILLHPKKVGTCTWTLTGGFTHRVPKALVKMLHDRMKQLGAHRIKNEAPK